ncbi:MAG: aminotransferase class IV [Nitrospirales bacterium]
MNDRFVRKEDAMVSVFDHGFLYGDGVYETLRAYGGRMFMLRRHLARLRRSASLIGLDVPIPEQDWTPLLQEAMKRNALSDAYLRITISRGEGNIGLDPRLCPRPTVVVISLPLQPYPAHLFQTGVSLAIVSVRRNLAAALSPQIKSLNFLNNILAKHEATQSGAFDGLMLNAEGHITECTTSNIFFVKDGCVRTPSVACGILDGITREVVLSLAREQELSIQEGHYTPDAVIGADECFLSNTTMEIMPVSDIDTHSIGRGMPGRITGRLQELFQANLPRFLE